MRVENAGRHQTIRKFCYLIISVLVTAGFWQLMQVSASSAVTPGLKPYRMVYILFLLVYLWFVHYFREGQSISGTIVITAILLTCLGIFGFFLESTNQQTFFFSGSPFVKFALFSGFVVLTYTFVSCIYRKLDELIFPERKILSDSSAFWLCFCGLIIGWVPFAVMNYPGSVARDTLHQLMQFSGVVLFSASHPLLDTCIYGALFTFGQYVWNDNFGVFLIVAFQILLCATAVARACMWIYKLSSSAKMCVITAVFFAVVPMWGAAVQCVLKDSTHLGFFLLFFVSFVKILYWKDIQTKDYIILSVHALLAAFSRKAAVAIVLISMVCLALYEIKKQKKFCIAIMPALIVTVFYLVINWAALLSPRVVSPAQKENYSLPFQMVARYCQQYGHEMSQDQIAVIDSVLDFDLIRTEYKPEISDAVKNTFHSSSDKMGEFWRLFIKLGLKHPKVYFEQLLLGNYKYFYPPSPGATSYRFYVADPFPQYPDFYDAHTVNAELQKRITNYCKRWANSFGSELLIGPGLYTWSMILLIGYALKHKSVQSIIAMMPIIILMIGFVFTPVNGENRYAYPLMAAVPICACIVISQINIAKKDVRFQNL